MLTVIIGPHAEIPGTVSQGPRRAWCGAGSEAERRGGDGAMNSVKQVPAWAWSLVVGALALKAATTASGGAGAAPLTTRDDGGAPTAPASGFTTLVACSV